MRIKLETGNVVVAQRGISLVVASAALEKCFDEAHGVE